jgi:hypothetical protein
MSFSFSLLMCFAEIHHYSDIGVLIFERGDSLLAVTSLILFRILRLLSFFFPLYFFQDFIYIL